VGVAGLIDSLDRTTEISSHMLNTYCILRPVCVSSLALSSSLIHTKLGPEKQSDSPQVVVRIGIQLVLPPNSWPPIPWGRALALCKKVRGWTWALRSD
jgi:hypothetical protein